MTEDEAEKLAPVLSEMAAASAEGNVGFVALLLRSHGAEKLVAAAVRLWAGSHQQIQQLNYARFVAVRDARRQADGARSQLEMALRENDRLRTDLVDARARNDELRDILQSRASALTTKRKGQG